MTAMLALDLGLPVPPPYLVQLSEDFIDTIPEHAFDHARCGPLGNLV